MHLTQVRCCLAATDQDIGILALQPLASIFDLGVESLRIFSYWEMNFRRETRKYVKMKFLIFPDSVETWISWCGNWNHLLANILQEYFCQKLWKSDSVWSSKSLAADGSYFFYWNTVFKPLHVSYCTLKSCSQISVKFGIQPKRWILTCMLLKLSTSPDVCTHTTFYFLIDWSLLKYT